MNMERISQRGIQRCRICGVPKSEHDGLNHKYIDLTLFRALVKQDPALLCRLIREVDGGDEHGSK